MAYEPTIYILVSDLEKKEKIISSLHYGFPKKTTKEERKYSRIHKKYSDESIAKLFEVTDDVAYPPKYPKYTVMNFGKVRIVGVWIEFTSKNAEFRQLLNDLEIYHQEDE